MACVPLLLFNTTHAPQTLWLTRTPARLQASLPAHHSPDHSYHVGTITPLLCSAPPQPGGHTAGYHISSCATEYIHTGNTPVPLSQEQLREPTTWYMFNVTKQMAIKTRAGSPRLKGSLSCPQEQGQCPEGTQGMLRDTVLSLAGWCPPSPPPPVTRTLQGLAVSLKGDTQVAGVSVQAVLCRSSCLVAPGGQGGGGSEARKQQPSHPSM